MEMLSRRQFTKLAAVGAASFAIGGAPAPAYAGTGGFTDVPSTHWLAQEPILEFLIGHYIVDSSNTNFRPDDACTREAAAAYVYRAFTGAPYSAGYSTVNTSGLTDVLTGKYYTAAINWGVAKGIMSGYLNSNGTYTHFGVGDAITRDHLVCMLYKAVNIAFGVTPTATGSIEACWDYSDVSSWARTPMKWAVTCGAVDVSSGYINPQNTATRAQAAKMLYKAVLWADPQREYTNMIRVPNSSSAQYVCIDYDTWHEAFYINPGVPPEAHAPSLTQVSNNNAMHDLELAGEEEYECYGWSSWFDLSNELVEDYIVAGDDLYVVIGVDERTHVSSTSVAPYKYIGHLECDANVLTHVETYYGTATLVSKTAAVSCAHLVKTGAWRTECRLFVHRATLSDTANMVTAKYAFVPIGYYDGSDAEAENGNDFALLIFPELLERNYGYMAYKCVSTSDESLYATLTHCIAGYPGTVETEGVVSEVRGQQWVGSKSGASYSLNHLSYLIDTSDGDSGAPVYAWNSDAGFGWSIVAIHDRHNDQMTYNIASRLNLVRALSICSTRVNGEGFTYGGDIVLMIERPVFVYSPSRGVGRSLCLLFAMLLAVVMSCSACTDIERVRDDSVQSSVSADTHERGVEYARYFWNGWFVIEGAGSVAGIECEEDGIVDQEGNEIRYEDMQPGDLFRIEVIAFYESDPAYHWARSMQLIEHGGFGALDPYYSSVKQFYPDVYEEAMAEWLYAGQQIGAMPLTREQE